MEVLTALGDAENDLYSANFADYSGGGGTKVSQVNYLSMHGMQSFTVLAPWGNSYHRVCVNLIRSLASAPGLR